MGARSSRCVTSTTPANPRGSSGRWPVSSADALAALAGSSALRATTGPGWRPHDDAGPIWVAVGSGRNVTVRPGYRVRYLVGFAEQVLSHTHPPRMRFEEACLDVVAITPSPLDRIQLLAGACQSAKNHRATPPVGA